MKHKLKISEFYSDRYMAILYKKRIVLIVLFMLFSFFNLHSQDTEKSTVELDQKVFTISLNYTSDSLMAFNLTNNLASEMSPFFMELYFNGYVLNEGKIEQNLNGIHVTDNTEYIMGPQFLGLGLPTLPVSGMYLTSFRIKNKLVENPVVMVRIFGELNGEKVIYQRTFSL